MSHKKNILITGCSTGIGLATAQLLHQQGHTVIASARKEEDVITLKKQGFHAVRLDVAESESVAHGFAGALEFANGRIDALVNNAGFGLLGAIEDISRQQMREQFETNVFGLVQLTNLVIPIMRQHGAGRIVNVSSVLGRLARQYYGAYTATKFAVEALSDTWRLELAASNIQVCVVEPGPIATRFMATAQHDGVFAGDKVQHSVHSAYYQRMKETRKEGQASRLALPPSAVANVIAKSIDESRPKARYIVGWPNKIFITLHHWLPTRIADAILLRTL